MALKKDTNTLGSEQEKSQNEDSSLLEFTNLDNKKEIESQLLEVSKAEDSAEPIVDIRINPPAAELSLGDFETEVIAILSRGLPNPFEARAEYMSALQTGRDNNCPGQGYSVVTSFNGCNSNNGWFFAGYTEYTGGGDQSVDESFHLLADFRFRDSDLRWFIGGGQLRYEPLGGGSWNGSITGTWAYDNGLPWMHGEGSGAVLTYSVTNGASWKIEVDGSINADGEYLRLRQVSLESNRCNGDVDGEIELRAASGYWYLMTLSCGCGQLSFAGGESLESGCVELSSHLQSILSSQ